jgi:hypothetical protein
MQTFKKDCLFRINKTALFFGFEQKAIKTNKSLLLRAENQKRIQTRRFILKQKSVILNI